MRTPGRAGQEGDEEMVVSGQTGPRDLGQDLAHDAAQRLLGENVVADVVFGHAAPGSGELLPIALFKLEACVNRI